MTAAWIIYSVLMSVLVLAGALAGERVARLVRLPVRAVWIAAMGVAVTLTALAPMRRPVVRLMPVSVVIPEGGRARIPVDRGWVARIAATMAQASGEVAAVDADLERAIAPQWMPLLLGAWAAAAIGLVGLFAVVQRRARRLARDCPAARVQQVTVRVAPGAGPMIVGVVRPEIVVPQWIFARTAVEQRLIVDHEDEHLRARDPQLLAVGWCLAALAPWNPLLWLMLSRLRLAVELDCDSRVLRRGVRAREYGDLLLDIVSIANDYGAAAIGLSSGASHLTRRINAMCSNDHRRFSGPRAGVAGLIAIVALATACEMHMPTAQEIQSADATSAQKLAKGFVGDTIFYRVDGEVVSATTASAVPADSIVSIRVNKNGGVERPEISIVTRAGAREMVDTAVSSGIRLTVNSQLAKRPSAWTACDSAACYTTRAPQTVTLMSPTNSKREWLSVPGLVYIDGVQADEKALSALTGDEIRTVDVLKGVAAAQRYGSRGENGVILITTKRGAAGSAK